MTQITLTIKDAHDETAVYDAVNETLRSLASHGEIDDSNDDGWVWTSTPEPRTARESARCSGTGRHVGLDDEIVDCPACGRPVRAALRCVDDDHRVIPSHGSIRTKNTDDADARLRERRMLAEWARTQEGTS